MGGLYQDKKVGQPAKGVKDKIIYPKIYLVAKLTSDLRVWASTNQEGHLQLIQLVPY